MDCDVGFGIVNAGIIGGVLYKYHPLCMGDILRACFKPWTLIE